MDPETFNFPYTGTQLTEQVNRVPNMFGMLNESSMFTSYQSPFLFVEVRVENGILRVLPHKERGVVGTPAGRETGDTKFIPIPHFPQPDLITPSDIQGIMALVNMTKQPQTMDAEMAKRLMTIKQNHDITREYLKLGALKGVVPDGDGVELFNWFDVFGISKKIVYFDLDTEGTDIMSKTEEVVDHVTTNLKGEISSRVNAVVSSTFFSKLVQHPKVAQTWLNYQAADGIRNMTRDRTGGNWGREFEFGNLYFKEYKATFPVKQAGADASLPAVTSGLGHAYPEGTMSTFEEWYGPADSIEAANKPGEQIHISVEILKHGKGVDIDTEQNTLTLCKRPEVLVELNSAAAP